MTTQRQNARLADLEREVSTLKAIVRQLSRPHQTGGIRRGHWKAKLNAELKAYDAEDEGSGVAMVSLWKHDGTALVDTDIDVEAHDWYLKSGESLAAGTRVKVEKHQDGKWWIMGAACD